MLVWLVGYPVAAFSSTCMKHGLPIWGQFFWWQVDERPAPKKSETLTLSHEKTGSKLEIFTGALSCWTCVVFLGFEVAQTCTLTSKHLGFGGIWTPKTYQKTPSQQVFGRLGIQIFHRPPVIKSTPGPFLISGLGNWSVIGLVLLLAFDFSTDDGKFPEKKRPWFCLRGPKLLVFHSCIFVMDEKSYLFVVVQVLFTWCEPSGLKDFGNWRGFLELEWLFIPTWGLEVRYVLPPQGWHWGCTNWYRIFFQQEGIKIWFSIPVLVRRSQKWHQIFPDMVYLPTFTIKIDQM